jgi:hypothetical protein
VFKGEAMKRIALVCLLAGCSVTSILAISQSTQKTTQAPPSSHESKATIEGLVRDIACPIQNLEAKATQFNLQCALECARHGSPLIIQTADGELFIPISDSMPDTDQRGKLMPFVGKYVRASGTVYERKGTRAIAISEIKEMKDVHLTTDAK